jgi:hypothetical protein
MSNNFNPFTFFSEKEWENIEHIYSELMVDFWHELETNPYTYMDYTDIENYIKTLGQFSDEQLKQMLEETLNQLI